MATVSLSNNHLNPGQASSRGEVHSQVGGQSRGCAGSTGLPSGTAGRQATLNGGFLWNSPSRPGSEEARQPQGMLPADAASAAALPATLLPRGPKLGECPGLVGESCACSRGRGGAASRTFPQRSEPSLSRRGYCRSPNVLSKRWREILP